MKEYKAIFFDWDGTAVVSREASVDEVVEPMKALLDKGVALAIISGTTYENIANGRLHEFFTKRQLSNLFLGLGRGCYNYAFDADGKPYLISDMIPNRDKLINIHKICFDIHYYLLKNYNLESDIIFSRPNYCKIDLMVKTKRGDKLFLQEGEIDQLKKILISHGFSTGIKGLVDLAEETGEKYGIKTIVTTDAKYLEVGISGKSDNVEVLLTYLKNRYGIGAEDCSFWGDEFVGVGDGLFGSDSNMMTERSKVGDFFDVSSIDGVRPAGVQIVGGGVTNFIEFLKKQITNVL